MTSVQTTIDIKNIQKTMLKRIVEKKCTNIFEGHLDFGVENLFPLGWSSRVGRVSLTLGLRSGASWDDIGIKSTTWSFVSTHLKQLASLHAYLNAICALHACMHVFGTMHACLITSPNSWVRAFASKRARADAIFNFPSSALFSLLRSHQNGKITLPPPESNQRK